MFEAVTVKSPLHSAEKLDIGSISEALLFYQNVHLIFDQTELFILLSQIGFDNFVKLINLPSVKATFLASPILTATSIVNDIPIHQFGVGTVAEVGSLKSRPKRIVQALLKHFAPSNRWGRKLTERTLEKIYTQQLAELVGKRTEEDFVWQASADLDDANYVQEACFATLLHLVPSLRIKSDWYVRVVRKDAKFVIQTNIDFVEANKLHKLIPAEQRYGGAQRVIAGDEQFARVDASATTWIGPQNAPEEGTEIDPTFLITSLLDTRLNLMLAFRNMSEFMTTPVQAKTMRMRFAQILRRRERSATELDLFRDLVFTDGKSLRGAMNAKEKTFADFLDLLEDAEKFRSWLGSLHPEDNLVAEYLKEISATGWLERLPSKTLRFAFFTGAGVLADAVLPTGLGTAAGVTLAASDSFLLDRIAKGWKPSQFVEGPMHSFVKETLA